MREFLLRLRGKLFCGCVLHLRRRRCFFSRRCFCLLLEAYRVVMTQLLLWKEG